MTAWDHLVQGALDAAQGVLWAVLAVALIVGASAAHERFKRWRDARRIERRYLSPSARRAFRRTRRALRRHQLRLGSEGYRTYEQQRELYEKWRRGGDR